MMQPYIISLSSFWSLIIKLSYFYSVIPLTHRQKNKGDWRSIGRIVKTNDLTDAIDWACELGKPSLSKLLPHSWLEYVSSRYWRGFWQLTVRSVIVMLPCTPKHKSIPPYHRFKVSLLILLTLFSLTKVNTYLETILLVDSLEKQGIL